MHVIAAFAALGLLLVVVFPFVATRLRTARRGRAVHLGGSCHWYANYDEDLRYEPKRRSDIVRLTRSDVLARGYRPTDDVQLVPRTFRHRVPGDTKVRLWRSDRNGSSPLWLCEWATDPVRVSIGVGERERVPGVESIPLADGVLDAQADDSVGAPGLGSGEAGEGAGTRPENALESTGAAGWGALVPEKALEVEVVPGAPEAEVSSEPKHEAAAVDPQPEQAETAESATTGAGTASDDALQVGPVEAPEDASDASSPVSGRQRKKRRRRRH